MFQLPSNLDHVYLLYGVMFTMALSVVFGLAAMFEPTRMAVASARRTSPMRRLAAVMSAAFVSSEAGEREQLARWLLQAGYEASGAVGIYFTVRLLAAILLPALVLVWLPLYVVLPRGLLISGAACLSIIGFLAPILYVRTRRARRQRKFREGLPDMLDLLLICSEAGLGLDMAIMSVGEEIADAHPLLAEQLHYMSTELRAGLERKDAMRSFANRTGIDETISLTNLLIQSDALGTGMAHTLRTFSEDMRMHRILKAEEQAHKVSAKLTLVVVGLFLPAIFAAAFVPAVYSAVMGMQSMAVVQPW
jgi:tight adherence protein C